MTVWLLIDEKGLVQGTRYDLFWSRNDAKKAFVKLLEEEYAVNEFKKSDKDYCDHDFDECVERLKYSDGFGRSIIAEEKYVKGEMPNGFH